MITAAATYNYDPQLVRHANEVVNQFFYGTLLREFREAQEPTIFDRGPGGRTFIRQLDMELIKRISQGGGSPLTEALLQQLTRRGAKGLGTAQVETQNFAPLPAKKTSVFPENRGFWNG
ncbi:MAG: hypothetical protein AMJ79_02555 [Phycisphaerae bacterium SM23_30]|nr:MAG: hypothetical protein AMJ79_02555 [Phycisphaerae bacterium SM23_30]